jgi:hypothetical protein
MILRKVITSDFYVEPFLRKKNTPVNNNPPLVKTNPATNNSTTKTTTKPPPANQNKNNPANTNKNTVLVRPKTDTVKKVEVEPILRRQKRSYYKAKYKNPGSAEIKGKQSCANTSDKFRKCFSEII